MPARSKPATTRSCQSNHEAAINGGCAAAPSAPTRFGSWSDTSTAASGKCKEPPVVATPSILPTLRATISMLTPLITNARGLLYSFS